MMNHNSPENELAAQLGVGRGSVREAIKAPELIASSVSATGTGPASRAWSRTSCSRASASRSTSSKTTRSSKSSRSAACSRPSPPARRQMHRGLRPAVAGELRQPYGASRHCPGAAVRPCISLDHLRGNRQPHPHVNPRGAVKRTLRARVWRGVIEGDASAQTIREHRAIHQPGRLVRFRQTPTNPRLGSASVARPPITKANRGFGFAAELDDEGSRLSDPRSEGYAAGREICRDRAELFCILRAVSRWSWALLHIIANVEQGS
jgi:hypothetical protein